METGLLKIQADRLPGLLSLVPFPTRTFQQAPPRERLPAGALRLGRLRQDPRFFG
jgi:hypothetical protein